MQWSSLIPLAALAIACSGEEPTVPELAGGGGGPVDATPAAATTAVTVVDQDGDVGKGTSLASGPGGSQHITYYDDTKDDLKYATCTDSCTLASNWTKIAIAQTGDVGRRSSLEVGSNGRPHVAYQDLTNEDLKYATCAPTADCTVPANWVKTVIDAAWAGYGSAIALGPDGSRHISYRARTSASSGPKKLKYATCSSGCGQAANWAKVTVEEPASSNAVWDATSIVIDSDGRRHISYYSPADWGLKYATCLSNCTTAANWQKLIIDDGPETVGLFSSIAVGDDGVLHVSHHELTRNNLKYARCAFDCTTAASWKKVTVRSAGDMGWYTSLAVDPNSRAHLSFSGEIRGLFYLTCNANCTVASSWSGALLDGAFQAIGKHSSLALGGGLVHISYYDAANGNLKYLERTP